MAETTPQSIVQRATVLVVDDEPAIRQIAKRVLEEAGFKVHEAGDAPEALALVAECHPIHLVVTDIRMPANGHTLAQELSKREPRIPILFISGFDVHPNLALGPVLPKPFTNSQLIQAVQDCYRRHAESA